MKDKAWYVEQHRAMWNWIADTIERDKGLLFIGNVESQWCSDHSVYPKLDSFPCEYDKKFGGDCKHCLFKWGELPGIGCADGYWILCCEAETWREQAEIARKIANLPVREEV